MRMIREMKEEDREVILHCPECRAVWAIDWPKDREEYFEVYGREPTRLYETDCPSCSHPIRYGELVWKLIVASGGTKEGKRGNEEAKANGTAGSLPDPAPGPEEPEPETAAGPPPPE